MARFCPVWDSDDGAELGLGGSDPSHLARAQCQRGFTTFIECRFDEDHAFELTQQRCVWFIESRRYKLKSNN